ncbi:glycosyltransferase family 4 protein [Bacillus mycoides]|uniref:glycosyltransferase family 4 protein n=1 Tax=Bacillus mycoides TaxID=1405 RepID=UPI0011AACECE|nr:glycosyltransferase family 4 protein [Bacillus mycoides]
MVKILILANNDVGLYKFRKELIQELIHQGNEVCISLPKGDLVQPLIDMGCTFVETRVDRRGINPFTDFKLLVHYIKVLMKIKPDMVMTYTIKPNIYGGIVSRLMKLPYAINITGLGTAFQGEGLLKKLIVNLYKFSCKQAKVVFFENEENKRVFINNNITKNKNSFKLNGAGVNLNEYQFSEYPTDNKTRFLFIGRVMKEKGIDELFEAVKLIKNEYDNVIFDVIGPFEDDYKDLITELQQQGFIEYHGFQRDVKPFIKQSHCFVLPSYHEGMANTLLECGAMGRPLITSNISGCKEAVQDNKSGFLVSVKSSEDLYNKIKRFIELPYEDKVTMGQASQKYIEQVFDKEKVVNMTIRELIK